MVNMITMRSVFLALLFYTVFTADVKSDERTLVVGVPTLLSGDWAGLGQNVVKTVQTYEKHYLRHPC